MMALKVQPLDAAATALTDPAKPAGKSLLKRLFERQLVKSSTIEKLARDGNEKEELDLELDRMILSYVEESNEKSSRGGRNRYNCFNGNFHDSSDDDTDLNDSPPIVSAAEILKGLIPCVSVAESNILSEATKIYEQIGKGKLDHRRAVADGLRALGYDAAVCKSRWEKTASFPDGEYEYVDVVVEDSRVIVDVEFRSEFEIARSTKSYRAVLQCLPSLFVGDPFRLKKIVAVVCEAALQSSRKKGLHFPPWRKPEYMRAKWLSSYQRMPTTMFSPEDADQLSVIGSVEEKVTLWHPPAARPKAAPARVIPGLSSVLSENS